MIDSDITSRGKKMRLEPLSEVAKCVSNEDACDALLSLCLSKQLRVYFPVPAGHVVAVYENALVEHRVGLSSARPAVRYRGRASIRHEVKWISLDESSLRQIRDANFVVLEEHFKGGLVEASDGYFYKSLDYCVIRRDSPASVPSFPVFRPEVLNEAVVFPTKHEIRFSDLSVSREDGALLRKDAGPREVYDKWAHNQSAPNVYRMYALSQEPYNETEFAKRLVAMDDAGVFTKAIATTAARILNKDVRAHAEEGLLTAKISDNAMGKDYSDPSLSKRMSLLLLATDCWLRDKVLIEEEEQFLQRPRDEIAKARESQAGSDALREMEKELAAAHMVVRNRLASRLFMPDGLEPYLEDLGFRSNQAAQMARVIKGQKVGGIHSQTKKASAVKR